MWTIHKQQQQRGVQFRQRKPGEPPDDEVGQGGEACDREQGQVIRPSAKKRSFDPLPLPEGK